MAKRRKKDRAKPVRKKRPVRMRKVARPVEAPSFMTRVYAYREMTGDRLVAHELPEGHRRFADSIRENLRRLNQMMANALVLGITVDVDFRREGDEIATVPMASGVRISVRV